MNNIFVCYKSRAHVNSIPFMQYSSIVHYVGFEARAVLRGACYTQLTLNIRPTLQEFFSKYGHGSSLSLGHSLLMQVNHALDSSI